MRSTLAAIGEGRIVRHYNGRRHVDRYTSGLDVTATSLPRAFACGFVTIGERDGDTAPLVLTEAGRDALARTAAP